MQNVGQSVANTFIDIYDAPCKQYNVPKGLILAIAMTESAQKPWTVNVAGKGFKLESKAQALQVIYTAQKYGLSYDIGIMQINSWWLKRLKITAEIAIEPHNNVKLGCYILAQEIKRYGFGWKAVGAYHSPTPWRQRQYAYKVAKYYNK